jgi:hypothetical protein
MLGNWAHLGIEKLLLALDLVLLWSLWLYTRFSTPRCFLRRPRRPFVGGTNADEIVLEFGVWVWSRERLRVSLRKNWDMVGFKR